MEGRALGGQKTIERRVSNDKKRRGREGNDNEH